jgi:clan AA aspartic protease (TIGR02281 family)
MKPKVVTIMIDSLEHHRVDRWIKEGELPVLARFRAEAARAPVKGVYPFLAELPQLAFATSTKPQTLRCWGAFDYDAATMQPIYARVMAELAPGRTIAAAPGMAQVVRRNDGHFTLDAIANGVKLSFMFDTGASQIVLRAQDAAKLGFDVEALPYTAVVQTANGAARAAPVTIAALTIGGITERTLRARGARRGALGENLLGQSFLERLASYGVEGDLLTLRGKAAQ